MIVCVDLIKIVARRTLELRHKFNLTQQELAELTDLSEVQYSKARIKLQKTNMVADGRTDRRRVWVRGL
jgi:hypothetical protein